MVEIILLSNFLVRIERFGNMPLSRLFVFLLFITKYCDIFCNENVNDLKDATEGFLQ